MADYSVKAASAGRFLAITHLVIGFVLVCFGIADYVIEYFWTGYGCFGIWIGTWMGITGGLGVPGTRKERSTSRDTFTSVFMGFSITSAVFGGIIIICYSLAIDIYSNYRYYDDPYYSRSRTNYEAEMSITGIILFIGILEFLMGIWTAICCCMMKPCTCCRSNPPQQGQIMHTTIAHVPGGPVPVQMQTAGGMVTVQAGSQAPQGGQPQMIMVPASEAVGGQPQFVQVATSEAMATAYEPHEVEMAESFGQGKYTPLHNEQV